MGIFLPLFSAFTCRLPLVDGSNIPVKTGLGTTQLFGRAAHLTPDQKGAVIYEPLDNGKPFFLGKAFSFIFGNSKFFQYGFYDSFRVIDEIFLLVFGGGFRGFGAQPRKIQNTLTQINVLAYINIDTQHPKEFAVFLYKKGRRAESSGIPGLSPVVADIVLFFPDPPGYHAQGKGGQRIADRAARDPAVGDGGYTHPVFPEVLQHNLAVFPAGPAQKIHQEGGGTHNVHVFIETTKKTSVKW
jgi:hypothetical protein